jgi:hypothetical protein
MQTIAEQKKAQKQGYSEDLIPHKLQEATPRPRTCAPSWSRSNQKVFSTSWSSACPGKPARTWTRTSSAH